MMRCRLQRWLPSEERLRGSRSLRWLRPLLQIFGAAAAAVLLRANLPVAAAATLVSNPVTYVPIWVAAHKTGSALLGDGVDAELAGAKDSALAGQVEASDRAMAGWAQRMAGIGKPLMLGLALFATAGAAVAWTAVHLLWIAAVALRRRRRRSRWAPMR